MLCSSVRYPSAETKTSKEWESICIRKPGFVRQILRMNILNKWYVKCFIGPVYLPPRSSVFVEGVHDFRNLFSMADHIFVWWALFLSFLPVWYIFWTLFILGPVCRKTKEEEKWWGKYYCAFPDLPLTWNIYFSKSSGQNIGVFVYYDEPSYFFSGQLTFHSTFSQGTLNYLLLARKANLFLML